MKEEAAGEIITEFIGLWSTTSKTMMKIESQRREPKRMQSKGQDLKHADFKNTLFNSQSGVNYIR